MCKITAKSVQFHWPAYHRITIFRNKYWTIIQTQTFLKALSPPSGRSCTNNYINNQQLEIDINLCTVMLCYCGLCTWCIFFVLKDHIKLTDKLNTLSCVDVFPVKTGSWGRSCWFQRVFKAAFTLQVLMHWSDLLTKYDFLFFWPACLHSLWHNWYLISVITLIPSNQWSFYYAHGSRPIGVKRPSYLNICIIFFLYRVDIICQHGQQLSRGFCRTKSDWTNKDWKITVIVILSTAC